MGLLNKPEGDKEENKVKKNLKKQLIAAAVAVGLKIMPLILVIAIVTSAIEWVIKIFQPKNTVNEIYKKLEIEDVSELIEIKGNSQDGYYLDFKADADKKLDDTIEYLNRTAGVKSGTTKNFLKKMIKAEVCTQFPDLGANVEEGSGFQGIVDILRITPNKEIGALKNTGAGQETVKGDDELNQVEINNKDVIKKQEEIIKKWNKGKELTLAAKAFVYSQEDSKLHKGEKIDYWTPQKSEKTRNDLELQKGATVTYTGEYSTSVNKMTNQGLIYVGIEKDNIKGYIKYNFIVNDSNEEESKSDEKLEDTGYSENVEEKVTDTIDSNVYKLTYIPKDEFDGYIKSSNKNVLYHFTIDDDGNLITATWSLLEDGKIEFQTNATINLKTALQNYITPYEYLMYFYMEADYTGFSSKLADKIFDSKIIIALEDNVTTTNTVETIENKKVSSNSSFSYDWTKVSSTETLTEYCSTKIEMIYADTWCVKLVDTGIYKSDLLNVSVGQPKNIKMPGTVTDIKTHEISEEREVATGSDTVTYYEYDDEGNVVSERSESYPYTIYEHTITDVHSISNSYTNGDKKISAKENVFVDLYKTHKMYNRMNDRRFLTILEQNERTANLVNLTKYLMYMATNIDYGVKEFDFSEYEPTGFEDLTTIYGNSFEEKVWFALIGAGYSEYSAAGAMGNFKQESGFKANNLQNSYEKTLGMTDETYTAAVNNGTYKNFVNDLAGYGLAQWTYPSRKLNFYNYVKSKGVGIDDEDAQIGFLLKEIKEHSCSKWKAAKDVEEACYYFEKEFENAGNPQMGNRLTYANEMYNKYKGKTAPTGFVNVNVKLTGESKKKMEALLQEAQRIANDDRYTYSQDNRYGEYQYDCSSLVARLYYKFFGMVTPSSTSTYGTNYRVGPASSTKLQPGDVLWRSGHVTIYIGNGIYVAAHGREGKLANNPAAQISVYNDSPSDYTYVYRFVTK